jgi:succinyl-CoA synthetase beta subunit
VKVHEYQGKQLLAAAGVPVPRGLPCQSVEEAVAAARQLGGSGWVVKAQVHAGGRGKGGGIRIARSLDELRALAGRLLGMQLVTPQTGPGGQTVRRLLIEELADLRQELYVGLLVERTRRSVCLMAAGEGGMDIEELGARAPDRIHRLYVDPAVGVTAAEADALAGAVGLPEASRPEARALFQGLYRAFWELDASLLEVNPLVLTGAGRLVALDVKLSFDANALFRHPELLALRDPDEEHPAERRAAEHGLSYIPLEGNIGCLVNGAGLAMATMDAIKLFGGSPANFLDVGGGATTEKVTEAFRVMLDNPALRAILVNIFGGIMRCDVIAEGLVTASRAVALELPLVVRMKGTNEVLGREILRASGLPLIPADTLAEAAERVVRVAANA